MDSGSLLALASIGVEASEQCQAYEEAGAKDVNFHSLPAVAKQTDDFEDFSYSATSLSPAPPAALAGKRAGLIGYVSEPRRAL